MEKKGFQTKPQTSVSNSPKNMLTPAPSHPRAWVFGAVFVILLILGIGIVVVLQQQKKATQEAAQQLATITPTAMPTPTPASPSADFVFYDDLDGKERFAVANNFTDSLLGVSFAYPPFYTVQAKRATKEETMATIVFRQQGNDAASVAIQPYNDTDADLSESTACRKEIATGKRVLISCIEPGNNSGENTMVYSLYLLGENPIELRVSSAYAKEQAHLIRSIISSATNHLR